MIGSKILYNLLVKPLSKLPFFLLYRLSGFFYLVLSYLIPYRKKVIVNNLKNSFPDKSENEINSIYKNFVKHFCDLILETLKTFSISKTDIQKHFEVENPEIVSKYYEEGRSVIMATGHYNNWEMAAVASSIVFDHKILGVYMPLKSKFWDKKIHESRGRFGINLVSVKKVKEVVEVQNSKREPYALCLIADQSPSNPYRCYWTNFLNQETGFLFGPEHYAKTYNLPVLYATIKKKKRGFYSVSFQEITSEPLNTEYGFITESYVKLLEKDIMEAPEFWLWTHKRWKKKKPSDFDVKNTD